jgi:hypothetical protein
MVGAASGDRQLHRLRYQQSLEHRVLLLRARRRVRLLRLRDWRRRRANSELGHGWRWHVSDDSPATGRDLERLARREFRASVRAGRHAGEDPRSAAHIHRRRAVRASRSPRASMHNLASTASATSRATSAATTRSSPQCTAASSLALPDDLHGRCDARAGSSTTQNFGACFAERHGGIFNTPTRLDSGRAGTWNAHGVRLGRRRRRRAGQSGTCASARRLAPTPPAAGPR